LRHQPGRRPPARLARLARGPGVCKQLSPTYRERPPQHNTRAFSCNRLRCYPFVPPLLVEVNPRYGTVRAAIVIATGAIGIAGPRASHHPPSDVFFWADLIRSRREHTLAVRMI